MSRGTFVVRGGHLVPKHEAAPLTPRGPLSSLPRPFVISDTCEFVSMASGQVVTSKAAYRADLRARGLAEVGNERLGEKPPPSLKPTGIKDDLRRTIAELSS